MAPYVVEAHNVSKRYRIGSKKVARTDLNDVLVNTLTGPARRLYSLVKNQLPSDAEQEFWALRDITFNIELGETMGLIGVNGSGKSTMLKIISNIVRPTEGYVITRGRIGSLLEVNAGFHPELTGRENVFLKGAIQGMSRSEISEQYEAIVDFSEIPEFMDTPIKRYSSGMRVRLGFSIAAMMRPDILIVDEAFAVGDVGFREKCLNEIEYISSLGKTIILVSHAVPHITRLCDRAVWLDKGQSMEIGDAQDVMDSYLDVVQGSPAAME